MTPRVDPLRLGALPDADVEALRTALGRAGFDERCVTAAEAIAPRQLDAVRVPAVLYELSQRDDDAALLTAVFVYGGTAEVGALTRALGAEALAALQDVGAIHRDGDHLRAALRILPYRGVWIASDEFHDTDPVMGPGMTTDELAHSLSFAGITSLLDVGCGAGSLALLARASGVADVVGTDIDPRAVAYATFNGRLNHLPCTWLLGDLTAPVAGRRFDAVVSQPAYVAQPQDLGGVTFLHGGARGDELALRLLGELDGVLGPRGKAWVLFDTPELRAGDLAQSVARAMGAGRFDVCLVVTPGNGAAEQSIAYASLRDRSLGPEYAAAYAAYRRHFAQLGIERVRHVLVHARGTATRGAGFVVEPAHLGGFSGAHLARLLDAVGWSGAADTDLLAAAVRPNDATRLVHEQSLAPIGDARLWVRFERGAGVEQELSDTAALLVTCLRDHQPLGAAITAWAAEVEMDRDEAAAQVLTFVRQGLRSGLLVVSPAVTASGS